MPEAVFHSGLWYFAFSKSEEERPPEHRHTGRASGQDESCPSRPYLTTTSVISQVPSPLFLPLLGWRLPAHLQAHSSSRGILWVLRTWPCSPPVSLHLIVKAKGPSRCAPAHSEFASSCACLSPLPDPRRTVASAVPGHILEGSCFGPFVSMLALCSIWKAAWLVLFRSFKRAALQVLGPGALGRPRGIGWRGRWGGLRWGIQVNVWPKPLQYCKIISLQLIKINEKKKKRERERAALPDHLCKRASPHPTPCISFLCYTHCMVSTRT